MIFVDLNYIFKDFLYIMKDYSPQWQERYTKYFDDKIITESDSEPDIVMSEYEVIDDEN